ncbi:MAG TPA: CBS domain-containing protein [Actinomycetota bacterium]|jgi:CBS domain-containing protein|nr:CBS domain-containing protein [Actinomycetota bacterium]
MSPRAAWRLELLGFRTVYDYVTGKQNWLSSGLPTEGEKATEPRAGKVARSDVPVCALEDKLGDVVERLRDTPWRACVVVNEERVVLGLLREKELAGDPGQTVEQAMQPGPSTFRPYVSIFELARFMQDHDLESAPITTGEGVLVGLLTKDGAVRAAAEAHRGHGDD